MKGKRFLAVFLSLMLLVSVMLPTASAKGASGGFGTSYSYSQSNQTNQSKNSGKNSNQTSQSNQSSQSNQTSQKGSSKGTSTSQEETVVETETDTEEESAEEEEDADSDSEEAEEETADDEASEQDDTEEAETDAGDTDETVEAEAEEETAEEEETTDSTAATLAAGATTYATSSSFNISWTSSSSGGRPGSSTSTTYFTVIVHYVDESGNEISGMQTTDLYTSTSTTYTFTTYAGSVTGYTYSGAYYNSFNGQEVTGVTFSQSGSTRTMTLYNSDNNTVTSRTYDSKATQYVNVYLVYTPDGFYIKDEVSSSGEYTIAYNGTEGSISDYTFVWYRDDGESTSDTDYPTSDDDWTEVTRTRVSGSEYNLTEDGTGLNVALDAELADASGSTRFWYKVEVKNSNGEVVATLYQKSMYYYELQNGSFEEGTDSTVRGMDQVNISTETERAKSIVWKTTDLYSLIELILPYSGTNSEYGVTEAAVGSWVAELNAESEGTLYQDVLTVPGSTLNWRLYHKARTSTGSTGSYTGNDTMYVVIMSEEAAASITTQDEVNDIIDAANFDQDSYYSTTTGGTPEEKVVESGTYAGAVVWRITDSTSDGWVRYVSEYTVPDGQYLTRFFFASGKTAYDNNNQNSSLAYTVGNLLDDVAFTTDILDPDEGSATLSVTKTVSGLSDDDVAKYTVTFDVTDENDESLGTITISNFTYSEATETWSGTGSLTIKLGTNETSKTVTITEQDATVEGYDLTATTVSGSAKQDDADSLVATATLNDASTTSVTYTNTYRGYFYVYHSSSVDGDIDKIYFLDATDEDDEDDKYADSWNDDGTFDITSLVATDYLYGGYYYNYAGECGYDDDGEAKDNGTVYDGTNVNWVQSEAGTEDGTKLVPVAGETYYLKEVPDTYLNPGLYVIYDTIAGDAITHLYLATATDDQNYLYVGFDVTDKSGMSDSTDDAVVEAANADDDILLSVASGALYEKIEVWKEGSEEDCEECSEDSDAEDESDDSSEDSDEDESEDGEESDADEEETKAVNHLHETLYVSDFFTGLSGYLAISGDLQNYIVTDAKYTQTPYFVTLDGVKVTAPQKMKVYMKNCTYKSWKLPGIYKSVTNIDSETETYKGEVPGTTEV